VVESESDMMHSIVNAKQTNMLDPSQNQTY